MLNALVIVYRESFEALLIVGLLYSFLSRKSTDSRGFRALGVGTLMGLGLSALLAFFLHEAETDLQGLALDVFQIAMLVLAIGLMTHMCIWMRKHARTLKAELEGGAQAALNSGNYLSLTLLCAVSVGREGSETAIFLYGLFIEAIEKSQMSSFLFMAIAGLFLGVATWYVFQKGFQLFSQKAYFTVSSILLFLTAGGLLLSVTRKLIQLDWMPIGREQAWDSSSLLSEDTWLGSIVSVITGYHSHPAWASLVAYVVYWGVALTLFQRAGQKSPSPVRVTSR